MSKAKPVDFKRYDDIEPNAGMDFETMYYSVLRNLKRIEAKVGQMAAKHMATERKLESRTGGE